MELQQTTQSTKITGPINSNQLLDRPFFDTTRKFHGREERDIFKRFRNWTNNTYSAYFVVNEDLQYRTNKGHYFLEATKHLKYRFDEISFYQFVILDPEFLQNNQIESEIMKGRRYFYCVDTEAYNEKVTSDHKPTSIPHPHYPNVRLFRTYETLLEHTEGKLTGKNIFIIGQEPLEKLRYFITNIQLTITQNSIIEDYLADRDQAEIKLFQQMEKDFYQEQHFLAEDENTVQATFVMPQHIQEVPTKTFPLVEFQTFLQFGNVAEASQVVVEKHKKQVKKYFSDYIKYKVDRNDEKDAIKSKKIVGEYQYLLVQRRPQNNEIYAYTPGYNRQNDTFNIRVLKVDNLAFIYDCDNWSDKVIDIQPWDNILGQDKLRKSNEQPYAINVTKTLLQAKLAINNTEVFELIEKANLQLLMR